jgi:phospholipid-binding lipoprotein MlaA
MNQPIFEFNEGVDKHFLEPVAEGWNFSMPVLFQIMIGNFFENLTMPRTLLNDLLQGKPRAAAQDLGRIATNTIAGVGGLIDVASEAGIPKNEEDFGQTFGHWGFGAGPYLVVPLAGPNCARDILAAPFDVVTNPTTWSNVVGLSAVRVVNSRARFLEEIDQARVEAIDYYVFVRDAYLQNRERAIRDGEAAPTQQDEDLYDLDEAEGPAADEPDAAAAEPDAPEEESDAGNP